MRVLWVLGTHESELGPTADRSVVARSPIASDRLRIAIPAAELSRLGVDSEFCVLRPGVPQPDPDGYDAVVFGKFGSPELDATGRVDWWWTFAWVTGVGQPQVFPFFVITNDQFFGKREVAVGATVNDSKRDIIYILFLNRCLTGSQESSEA